MQDLIAVAENYGAVLYDTWTDYKPSSQKKGTWNKLNAKLFHEKINPDLPPKSWDALDKEASLYKIKSFKVSKFEDIKIQLSLGRPILALIQQKDLYNQPTIQNVRSSILSTKTILIVRYDSDQDYLLAYGGRFLRKDVEYFESHLRYTKIRFDEAKRLFDFAFIWSIDML